MRTAPFSTVSKWTKTRLRGAKLSLRVHPLFAAALLLSAFTGQLLLLLAAVFAALEHELAHAAAARRMGFSLDKIVLMPYGAVISGDLAGIPPKDEIMVCLAGPLCSGLTALGFAALWWLYPETYPYTDVAAYISLSLFLVNLLPAFPLDGGRIVRVLLRPLGERKSALVCRILSLLTAAGILGYFVYTCCIAKPGFGALFFAVFLFAGGFGGGKYTRLAFAPKDFSRGIEEKRIALSAEKTAGEAMRYLREDKYLTLLLFEEGEFAGEISEEELLLILQEGGYGRKLKDCLSP